MKKAIVLAVLVAALGGLAVFQGSAGEEEETALVRISKELGMDVSSGSVISSYDSHGGNGDGASCIAVSFTDDSFGRQLEGKWAALPLNGTVRALVYGESNGAFSCGPYLTDGQGNRLVPVIKHGYAWFLDRHRQAGKTGVLERASFNFTAALYDADTSTLYFCKLDT